MSDNTHQPPDSIPAVAATPPQTVGASLAQTKSGLLGDRQTNRIVIFTMLFGVTGALGLPLLWFSKSFTPGEKLLWSLLITLYTLLLIGVTLAITWWAYLQIFRTSGL